MEIAEQLIAKRIRELRLTRRLTLQKLAERAGFSRSFLSKLEHCHVSINVATLSKLADALGVPLGGIFQMNEPEADAIYVPLGSGRSVSGNLRKLPYEYEVLVPMGGRRQMEPVIISIDGRKAKFELREHPGEQLIYMLEGEMGYVCGNRSFVLRSGDCLYFSAATPHGPKLRRDQKARYLVVITRRLAQRSRQ
ncbi:MAG TPA: XRE family transcriptional regulator [Terriglobia bacterium]|nr:XRE family transcriptional regulator [Terriglobia bacterium]